MIEQGNKYFRWRQPACLASGRSTDSKPMWIWVLLTKLPPFNWTYAKGYWSQREAWQKSFYLSVKLIRHANFPRKFYLHDGRAILQCWLCFPETGNLSYVTWDLQAYQSDSNWKGVTRPRPNFVDGNNRVKPGRWRTIQSRRRITVGFRRVCVPLSVPRGSQAVISL